MGIFELKASGETTLTITENENTSLWFNQIANDTKACNDYLKISRLLCMLRSTCQDLKH